MADSTVSLIEREKKLSTYGGDDRIVKSDEILTLLKTQKDPFSFSSKLSLLDEWLEGFEAGELVVVSGLTGQGKTTFCQTLSFNFFAQDISSLWFSYEMTYRQFLHKLSEELFVYMPLLLKGKSIDWIRDRIHEAKLKYNIRAVFIDHLHFLVDMAKLKSPSLEIGSIVRGLKRIALDFNVTIFLIAHSTKIKFDEEPELDSIRDSSFIPQDADIVLIVWRGKEKSGEFNSIIFIGRKLMNNLFTLWAMYREIPGWLWICKALDVDEEGLRKLEEMDDAYIHCHRNDRGEYEKEVNTRIQELISEIPKEYQRERRKEYLTTLIAELSREIEGLQKDYEESLRNDETYDNRAVLAYGLECLEKVKAKHGAELRALKGNGEIASFDNKLLLARQRKFGEFLELKKGKAICPFHPDHDPSFSVKGNRGHCFGCGWRGDVVDFVMALKGFSFKEALELLAC